MSQYGSLNNSLYGRMVIGQPEPEIGMGASILAWSDRYAASVVQVSRKYRVGGKGSFASLDEAKAEAAKVFAKKGVVAGIEEVEVLIAVQHDHAKVVKGSEFNGSAEYEYSANPEGSVEFFRKGKDGVWEGVYFNGLSQRWKKSGGHGLRLGERRHYRDPSF